MSNITKRGSGFAVATGDASRLLAGISESRASTPIIGGKPLLRLLRDGEWVFGQQDDPVQEGSEWAVNPYSIMHGWVCWTNNPDPKTKNELLGEVMGSVADHKPVQPEPIRGFSFKEQRSFEAMCILGDDEGTEVLFKTSSVGGMRGFDVFLAQLQAQIKTGSEELVAIVQLESSPYEHSSYGRIYNPVLDIVGWADMEGNRSDGGAQADLAPKPAPEKPKGKPSLKSNGKPAPSPSAASSEASLADDEQPTAAARPGAAPKRQRPVPAQ